MRMTAIVAGGLAAAALATAACGQADVAPTPGRPHALAPAPQSDPEAEVAERSGWWPSCTTTGTTSPRRNASGG